MLTWREHFLFWRPVFWVIYRQPSFSLSCIQHGTLHTVQTVAADLRQGEHIPKMQNDIGHKSKLRMLRQRGGKEAGGGGGRWLPCRTVPCRDVTCRARPRRAVRRSAWRCVLHNCREFKPDRTRRIRQRQRQKHHGELEPTSFRSLICHSTNCATLPLWIIVFLTQPSLYCTVYYTILYYTILYYAILYYYTILYYTILCYTILCYTILYYTILYYTILYYTILYLCSSCGTLFIERGFLSRTEIWEREIYMHLSCI